MVRYISYRGQLYEAIDTNLNEINLNTLTSKFANAKTIAGQILTLSEELGNPFVERELSQLGRLLSEAGNKAIECYNSGSNKI